MSHKSKDSSDEWELVTKEGELDDESEEDGSCSGSSIELLTSDEEVDGTSSQDPVISGSGSNKSGQFFVLRLRSKEYSAESDSDEKDLPVKSGTVGKESSSSSQSGERSEPELLLPITTDEDSNDEQQLNETLQQETEIGISENDLSKQEQYAPDSEPGLDTSILTSDEQVVTRLETGGNGNSTEQPTMAESRHIDDMSTKISDRIADKISAVKETDEETNCSTQEKLPDDDDPPSEENEIISIQNSLDSSISLENNSITVDTAQVVPEDLEIRNHIVPTMVEEKVIETHVIPNQEGLASNEDTDSMRSSNFSLVDEADCQIEAEVNVRLVESEPVVDENLPSVDDKQITLPDKPLIENLGMLATETTGTSAKGTRVNSKPSKWTARLYCCYGILDLLALLTSAVIFFTIGTIVGFNLVNSDGALTPNSNVGQNLAEELDVFHTHLDKFKRWKKEFDKKPVLVETELRNLFSVDQQKNTFRKGERSQNLENELIQYEHLIADILISSVQKAGEGKKAVEENSKLKILVNDLRNENADLEDKVVEHGKRKYLLSELEEENLALIKRISDMESQLMEAQDKTYILQLQISKLEKRLKTSEYDQHGMSATELRKKLDESEKEVIRLKNQIVEDMELISWLRKEKNKLTADVEEAERWKKENVDLKTKWSELSVQVQHFKKELRKATGKVHVSENQFSDHKETDIKARLTEQEREISTLKLGKEKLQQENLELSHKFIDMETRYRDVLEGRENSEEKDNYHGDTSDDDSEDEGIDIESDDDETDTNDGKVRSEHKERMYPKPGKWTLGKISREKVKKEQQKQDDQSENRNGHKSWTDAMNEILNKTKSSMVNVSKQIQDTLSEVKNLSQELWKKHEPQVNQMLTNTYESVKKNVNKVTEKVSKVASKIIQKSVKLIQRYRKLRKNRRHRKYKDDSDEETFTASTGRRGHKSKNHHHNHNHHNPHSHHGQHDHDHHRHHHHHHHGHRNHHDHDFERRGDEKANGYPGFLENELQNLRDSVEYVNTLQQLKCNELIDIMEDFQDFKKSEGVNILSNKEKSWFFCQKDWFEGMVHSIQTVHSDCRDKLVRRQIAAVDFNCCPCLGQYGKSKGKFCDVSNGCIRDEPKESKFKTKKSIENFSDGMHVDNDKTENNETAEETATNSKSNFIYCDPFSQDLDCGDESWYLKRMKDRSHLRKYRSTSESDWMFQRAADRDYKRTQPDDWFFNRMDSGQSYEAFQDDSWSDTENWYIKKINDDKKAKHDEL